MRRLVSAMSSIDRRFQHVSILHPRMGGAASTVVTSDVAEGMATAQLRLEDGGMTEAFRTGTAVVVTAKDRPARFPVIQPTADALGVDVQLAVPLLQGRRPIGVLSVYSTEPFEVDPPMLEVTEALASQAALVVEQHLLVGNLQVGLETRQHIGQACGILMSRFVLDGEQAFQALRRASQNRNVKARELALEVIRTGTLPELEEQLE